MSNKIETYIGFAIKKGSVVWGCDAIAKYRKKAFLIVRTDSLSDNSAAQLAKDAARLGCKIVTLNNIAVMTEKRCKALAICDKSLADAIADNLM